VTMVMHDLGFVNFNEPISKFFAHGLMIKDGAKMSKSRGNVVTPDAYLEKYGADTFRLYTMFLGPMDGYPDFRDDGIEGMHRFVKRLWKLFEKGLSLKGAKRAPEGRRDLEGILHKTIKKVTEDIQAFRYNTAIASLMILVNALEGLTKTGSHPESGVARAAEGETLWQETLCKLLAPFTPHLAEEVWEKMGHKTSVHTAIWPKWEEKYLIEDTVTIIIQVNGKLRGQLSLLGPACRQAGVTKLAKEQVAKWLEGKSIKKTIYVPGKLVNFVV